MIKNNKLAIDGGKPVRSAPWPSKQHECVQMHKKYFAAVSKVLTNNSLFRYGDDDYLATMSGKYETALKAYFQSKHVLALTSGTSALACALLASGIKEGSQVACPSFTFAATPSAILMAKCKPLLIEVDENLHLDLEDLRRKCSAKLAAIVPVHMRGFACDIEAITKFAKKNGLKVIEDNAAACGVEFNGRKLGTFGDAGAFSTQADKFISTGEGGFLVTDDDDLFRRALVYSGAFIPGIYSHPQQSTRDKSWPLDFPLYSLRIDELRSAIGYVALKDVDKLLLKQQRIYDEIVERLKKIPQLYLRKPVAAKTYLGNKLVFRIPGISVEKAALFARALCAEGINVNPFGDLSTNNQRVFWNWRFLFKDKSVAAVKKMLPQSARYISESFDIPLSPQLTKKDVLDLVRAIEKVLLGSGI